MYAFSSYETQLKARMGWEQSQVELMGVAMHTGTYMLKPVCGAILDKCELCRPPVGLVARAVGSFVSCSAAAAQGLVGYGVVGLVVAGVIPGSVPLLGLCFLLVGMSSAQGYVTALYTAIPNFAPEQRGKVVGAVAAMFGGSAILVASVYTHGFEGGEQRSRLAGFFGLLAVLMCTVNLVGAGILRVVPLASIDHSLVELDAFDPDSEPDSPKGETQEPNSPKADQSLALVDGQPTASPEASSELPKDALAAGVLPFVQTVMLLFSDTPYVCIYLQFAVSAGVGLFCINNLGAMQLSLNSSGEHDGQAVNQLVVTLSVCNMSGRLLCGWLLDAGVPPMRAIAGCTVVLSLSCLQVALITVGSEQWLFLTAAGVGLGYGGLWTLCPAVLASRFGMPNFGKIFGMTTTAPALTSFVFNEILASVVYGSHVSDNDNTCRGNACFCFSALLIGGLGLLSAIVPVILKW